MPADVTPGAFQATMDAYAWQLFVATSWPASPTQRGVPDATRTIGDAGMTVWETLKDVDEVFLPAGAPPAPWNSWPSNEPAACAGSGQHVKHLTMQGKVSPTMRSVAQAVGGALTDQRKLLARYAESMNEAEFTFIVDQKLYDANVQKQLQQDLALPLTSMEVKSAWREWTDADKAQTWSGGGKTQPLSARYYIQSFCVCDPDGSNCGLKEMALVGLHISRKAKSAPEWTWATFEQTDNVDPTAPYTSFFNHLCDSCPANKSTEVNGKPTGVPTQVTRLTSIDPARLARNKLWQQALAANPASPWQYYQLIGIQWPTKPLQPALNGVPTPDTLANAVMETYNQNTSSCALCHGGARLVAGATMPHYSDYSFLLGHATAAPVQPAH